jgi:hypothetical protein
MASLAGLTVVSPRVFAGGLGSPPHSTNFQPYTGKLFLNFHAVGGWHPPSFANPKIANGPTDSDPPTHILAKGKIGDIEYPTDFPDEFYNGGGAVITAFFEKHANRLTVVNGIDQMTNGHDDGRRHTWSGKLQEGYPSIGALIAAAQDPTLPMSYLAFGGFSETAGTVGRTRANNLDVLAKVAYAERPDPADETSTYQPRPVLDLINEAQDDRDRTLRDEQRLPRLQRSLDTLYAARSGSEELRKLMDYLPTDVQGGMLGQVQVAIAAYKAGLCVAVELSAGGFDTHSNSDTDQISALEELLAAVDFAWDEAERQQVANKTVISLGSDFGRTLGYNGGMGTDHWPVGSMLFMGAGVPKNRTVGGTDSSDRAYGIKSDLSLDTNPSARKIEPRDIHYSLRKLAGVHNGELAQMFPLDGANDPIDLFA